MVLCSVDDVRVHANPTSISDAEITSIISVVSTEILTKAGSTDETNPYLIQAGIHASAAIVLKRARAAGELASSVETPESKVQISGIDTEIKQHETERDNYLALYTNSVCYSFSSTSLHYDFGWHHHQRGH